MHRSSSSNFQSIYVITSRWQQWYSYTLQEGCNISILLVCLLFNKIVINQWYSIGGSLVTPSRTIYIWSSEKWEVQIADISDLSYIRVILQIPEFISDSNGHWGLVWRRNNRCTCNYQNMAAMVAFSCHSLFWIVWSQSNLFGKVDQNIIS